MNVRDSEVIAGLLQATSYELTTDSAKADVVILNTCSVRQHAEEKVWSEIGKYKKFMVHGSKFMDKNKKLRTKNYEPRTIKPIIGVVGCMAQNYKDEIFKRSPEVDFVVGTTDIEKIPQIINKLVETKSMFERKIWETEGDVRPEEIYHTGYYEDKNHAHVVISEGCSNFCSYCVVPYVRGPLRNRDYKEILQEIEEAISKGVSEITLLGQNVNSYKSGACGSGQEVDFIKLLKMVDALEGLKEFGFVTSHPKDTSVDLFKAMADCKKLKKALHLPVQSGSDKILKLMNRGYTRKYYLDLADNYRKIVKAGSLSTDIIVGFPTETKEDFKDTYDLLKRVGFNSAFIFKYSSRPHTKALELVDDVPQKEKEERHHQILELQRKISKGKK